MGTDVVMYLLIRCRNLVASTRLLDCFWCQRISAGFGGRDESVLLLNASLLPRAMAASVSEALVRKSW